MSSTFLPPSSLPLHPSLLPTPTSPPDHCFSPPPLYRSRPWSRRFSSDPLEHLPSSSEPALDSLFSPPQLKHPPTSLPSSLRSNINKKTSIPLSPPLLTQASLQPFHSFTRRTAGLFPSLPSHLNPIRHSSSRSTQPKLNNTQTPFPPNRSLDSLSRLLPEGVRPSPSHLDRGRRRRGRRVGGRDASSSEGSSRTTRRLLASNDQSPPRGRQEEVLGGRSHPARRLCEPLFFLFSSSPTTKLQLVAFLRSPSRLSPPNAPHLPAPPPQPLHPSLISPLPYPHAL